MAATVTTRKTELGDARVRLDVEVEPGTVEREIQSAARELGRDMRLAGFRKGKVPPPVVIQRVGREAVLDEAVRRALPGWYEQAVSAEGLVTVGDPKVDLEELPEKGSPLGFSVEVAVRPLATLGEYEGLEVGRREPAGGRRRGGRRGRPAARVAGLARDRRPPGRRGRLRWCSTSRAGRR